MEEIGRQIATPGGPQAHHPCSKLLNKTLGNPKSHNPLDPTGSCQRLNPATSPEVSPGSPRRPDIQLRGSCPCLRGKLLVASGCAGLQGRGAAVSSNITSEEAVVHRSKQSLAMNCYFSLLSTRSGDLNWTFHCSPDPDGTILPRGARSECHLQHSCLRQSRSCSVSFHPDVQT